jgi:hypothetical protein
LRHLQKVLGSPGVITTTCLSASAVAGELGEQPVLEELTDHNQHH